jgi:glycosyltransferase involved in cell wall biosynthesis
VTSSQHYADHYYTRYGPLVQVIPWGAEVRSSPPSRPKSQSGMLNVLFVGQMRPYKGVETLLAAVAGQSRLKLTLVGSGAKLGSYMRLAERLGATNTQFLGLLTDEELQEQYDANDVIVLPSVNRAEAFGLVLLEGMAAGCVPVASDLPGVRDVAGPTGVLVAPGDLGELRTALAGLADDNDRLESLQANSWLAAQALSWERCIDSYESVLFDAVRSRYAQLHGIAMLPEIDQQDRSNKKAMR